jgi:molecular chaperone Hsp33
MSNSFVQRFLFDKLPIRGAFVILEDTWQTIASQKIYPDGVQRLLGELLAANVLITTTLKLKGKITAQIQDNPKLDLIVSECDNEFFVRATAKYDRSSAQDEQIQYKDCLAVGNLVISIDSKNDGKLYQSVVGLSKLNLDELLGEYMMQSEQLRTMFIIAYSATKTVGFMLQQLPDNNHYANDIERVFALANSLTKTELSACDVSSLLHKLFNADDILLYDPDTVLFRCTCGRERVSSMLRSLGKVEADAIILQYGSIKVTCDYCNSTYIFDADDVLNIFSSLDIDMENISHEIH